ncbi:ExeA family protein [Marinibactrum halimedae]|uniref:MSHA biogenesis protein MshM n=1 Tax=Marinibactrum halimedae TaxID=1444977 RepID=A0AA37T432_9GAMM|nr:AAA family ATPase [Marinibactrum halimedae]MCD9461320.1 AAA family ATPase [Marinibactrum halimedae]GLS24628.1 MSHA biogenesis protein MshM [Marinibactrum halimedae]
MINAVWGITQAPFKRDKLTLLPQQNHLLDIIKIHAQQGGFSVVIGEPGVGKTVLREHIEQFNKAREYTVASCSRTLHTYRQIIWQLADSFQLETTEKNIESDLIECAFSHIRERKTLYILIDEAHLLDTSVLRKLRLLFERFPKNHNLVLFGQPSLLHYLSLSTNKDIKSRITYSATLKPLNQEDMERYIVRELESVKMGINTFDEAAMALIIRSSEGNLRLCRNLCLGSLIEAARETKRVVSITHVNNVLVQPHWRSHEELITQQVLS